MSVRNDGRAIGKLAAAVVVVLAASGFGLGLGAAPGETLRYSGFVVSKKTSLPIAGATVTVRRSVYLDPKTGENRILEETKHTTNLVGMYSFSIPPAQAAEPRLYLELDVEHPDYAPRTGF